ncbi:MAG TPA: Pls/PosA family non-ribosomal peptide synthetase [Streptosporangiaceae bacterium]|nr:Pls/PosA family non-ribosomal peptide synthetase [Streptosporangiaceae bacterium]
MTTAQFDADLVTAGLQAMPSGAIYSGAPAPPPRTLLQIIQATAETFPRAAAIDDGQSVLDYLDLLREVRRVAHRLASMGIGAGDRVGIRVPSGTAKLYLSILAVLSVGAAYVPVDMDDPDDRAERVWSEAGVCAIVSDGGALLRREVRPTGVAARRPMPEDDAWIIFTSGTTGTPKGVAVTHRNAAAFVDAEANLFLRGDPLRPGDRVLAGLSVAFDASCEEMWLAWRHGACLVPAPRSVVKMGPELVTWWAQRRVSVVSTVPTMAALWPADSLHGIRLLILGGEACPSALAGRLVRQGTEMWNTYGPTEATVVSCGARLSGGEPVRIGLPLDGWRCAVVDPASGQPVPWGKVGELVIGGVGVARYLDSDKDAVNFRPLEALGWERAYRSGDLARADPEGLVYLGRADTQVKIRGYRIELSEIEAVLMRLPAIGQAAVATYEPHPGVVELVGYYRLQDHAEGLERQAIYEHLGKHLPQYMVPHYLEQLPAIPVLRDGKADHRNLPPPTSSPRLGVDQAYIAPATPGEKALADALAELLGLQQMSVDYHFFDDLGMSSLMVAHFCAQVRERAEAPPVSTKDVYLHPTIRSLATTVTELPSAPRATSPPRPATLSRAGTAQYVVCGVLQLLAFLASVLLAAVVVSSGFSWISASAGGVDIYLRSLAFSAGAFFLLCTLPILTKWTLVGRWKPQEIKVWSLPYLRFWLVKTLVRANPLALFTGSPIYPLYLRALGAKIGRRVVILSATVPVCTDMLTIGDDTVIRRESSFTGYRALAGVVQTGPVSIGREALVGEHTVLDIGTCVGDGSQLGHTSSLYESQAVPDGQRWHGSPAQRTDVDYCPVNPIPSRPLRRAVYGTLQLLSLIFVTMPLAAGAGVAVLTRLPVVAPLASLGAGGITMVSFYQEGLIVSIVLFGGAILTGAAVVLTIPRILQRFITPGHIYPLYGLHHSLHRAIRRLTNIKFYLELTGDSSYVVPYLRALGYRLPDFEQTGSNFGADLEHETPFLIDIGRSTMISDGATLIDADYSSTSFRVRPLSIGPRNFLGNAVAYPAGGRIGENCLIATKAMVPLDGPVRDNVGLLGSPSFEIPRSVTNDHRFDHLKTGEEFHRRLRAKNRHNLATMGLFLAVRWVHTFVITLLAMAAWELYGGNRILVFAGLAVAVLLFSLSYFITVERALMRFGSLRPQYCSIYDPYFWWHERYWKLMAPLIGMLNGTPFKNPIWRLVGVRIGRRVFDDGCSLAERTLVTIGDDCTLNAGSVIQCHSMEDGTFKADYTVLEDGCTLGTGALVHYGVTMGQGAQLQPDSFLMKGEKVPPHARWGGNPARPMC